VIIIGDGVIGLSIAYELGRAGVRCRVFGATEPGAASGAAAGLLAPSIGNLSGAVRLFFDTSLALYPAFVEHLREYEPGLAMITGLIELSTDDNQVNSSVASPESTRRACIARLTG
jgi:glycine/D-amino acid oxidase-like deaminating enzyme